MKFLVYFTILFLPTQNFCHSQNDWTQEPDFIGDKRVAGVGFSIDSNIYFGTGVDSTNVLRTDFWKYDPNAHTWSQIADIIGSPLYLATGFSISGKGYICLGQNSTGSYLKSVFEYDPVINSWQQKSDFPGDGRIYSVAFTINPYAYLGSGSNMNTGQDYSDFWQYEPSADSWSQKADIGFGIHRTMAAGFSEGGKGYIGTGLAICVYCGQKDFWSYDTTSGSWTQLSDFGGGERYNTNGFSLGGFGYLGFGRDTNQLDQSDFWQYNILNNYWILMAPVPFSLPFPGYGSFVISNGESAYIQRGFDVFGHLSSEFYRYGPVLNPGIEEIKNKFAISVYPNPVTNISTIISTAQLQINDSYECEIYNGSGFVVWKHSNFRITDIRISTSDFQNGIYYLRLRSDLNKLMVAKFVIQK